MANREILHSLFASFCGGFDIFEQNLFINATHLYLFIILLSLPFIIFMVSNARTSCFGVRRTSNIYTLRQQRQLLHRTRYITPESRALSLSSLSGIANFSFFLCLTSRATLF